MNKIILTFSIVCFSFLCQAQRIDKKLQNRLTEMVKGFGGTIGFYVKDLKKNKIAFLYADTVFPTASVVKVPIMLGVMDKIHKGELDYDSELTYKDSLYYAGEDVLSSLKNGEKIRLKKVVLLMLSMSDNTASLWLQSLAGKGPAINRILDSLGYRDTRVNSRTPGREANRETYGWGQTTPREMAQMMEMIYNDRYIDAKTCDRIKRCLGRNYWDEEEAISQIPPTIEAFSKNGCLDAVRNEIVLVNAPGRPYILSIFTKNNKDTSWNRNNEAWTLTRKISAYLFHYFQPRSTWQGTP